MLRRSQLRGLRPSLAAAVLAAMLAGSALAQGSGLVYRERFNECVRVADYPCAFEVLMEQGNARWPKLPVAVSAVGGPTAFGLQMFGVLDQARDAVERDVFLEMAGRAVGYAYDAQPNLNYAAGPFILLYGEACREQGDIACIDQSRFALQLMLDANQWYLNAYGDGQGRKDVLARARTFVEETREVLQ